MRIQQITSKIVCGPERFSKWYCVDSIVVRGDTINRYLQADGSWGRVTHYFDTNDEIAQQLSKGIKPNFTVSSSEAYSIQGFKDWQDSQDEYESNLMNTDELC